MLQEMTEKHQKETEDFQVSLKNVGYKKDHKVITMILIKSLVGKRKGRT